MFLLFFHKYINFELLFQKRRSFNTHKMKKISTIFLLFSLILVISACKKDNDISEKDRNFDASLPAGQMTFSVMPVDTTDIGYIMALGHVAPPGHTIPTDHIYFVNVPPGTILHAPASGKVLDTFTFDEGNGQHDNRITIGVTSTASYYFMHVVLDAGIKTGNEITAGQRLGVLGATTVSGFDMGAMVKTITQPFLDPQLYGQSSLHCDAPIKHFPAEMQRALYAKVRRLGTDKDGKICYDVPGTLSGNWIAENAPRDPLKTDNFSSYFVAFVYGNYDPSKMVVSIGNDSFYTHIDGYPAFTQSKVFYVQDSAPAFGDVTPASGKVTYKLYYTGEFGPNTGQRAGLLLVQMMAKDKIKIELFDDTVSETRDFTANAKIYVR